MNAGNAPNGLRIAMMGTRGVPARYGGFETAIEEIGSRLVHRGHRVTVYCRRPDAQSATKRCSATKWYGARWYEGMRCVELPALRRRALETPSHTAISTLVSSMLERQDAVFMFNAANAAFLPALQLRATPVALHVDGLEWQRTKWSGAGRCFYRRSESLGVRWADALIADAAGLVDYYREEFSASTELLSYGAPLLDDVASDLLGGVGVEPGRFHLVVARFEPENHVEELVRGFVSSNAQLPLVVVGGAPYSDGYTRAVHAAAASDPRVRFMGPLWDQELLDQLYAHAVVYLHGHSVGGTNPSLLRAMGAGTAAAAWDVGFNREVLGDAGWFVDGDRGLARVIETAEHDIDSTRRRGDALANRAAQLYRWDAVSDGYEQLARRLATGWSRRGECSGRRRTAGADVSSTPPAGERVRS